MPETSPDDLLPLALSRPRQAELRARRLLARHPDAVTESIARQAIGIVLRERGDLRGAVDALQAALRAARRSRNAGRMIDVQATLGVVEAMDGRTRSALARLSRALKGATGGLGARVLLRRGHVLYQAGRYPEALEDLRRALATFREVGDLLWEARVLHHRCVVHLALGSVTRAEHDVLRAEALFTECGQEYEAAQALESRGFLAYRRGDLPAALRLLDQAAGSYRKLDLGVPELTVDQSMVFLAAGLPAEAFAVVVGALDGLAGQPSLRADLLLAAATAALALPDPVRAEQYGRAAERLFRRQGRTWWAVRARLIVARARFEQGEHGARLLTDAMDVAAELQHARVDEATLAWLVAGDVAAARGDGAAADYFGRAAAQRGRGSALNRSLGWLAQARLHELAGRRRATLVACNRGIDALDEHRMLLGSPELRALATSHGRELASLALTTALATGDARPLLTWTERIRATALSQPPVLPSGHARLRSQLARLRDVVRRLNEARDAELPTGPLERERDGLEAAIRREQHQLGGRAGSTQARFELAELTGALGEHVLVELVEVAGVLHALVVRGGRVTRALVGSLDSALEAVEYARFQLRRVGRGARPDLAAVGSVLADGVLGAARHRLGDGPVIIVPPSRLHGTPWGLMPGLAQRPITVSPSAAMWLRSRRIARPSAERLVLVAGPDLGTEGAEVVAVAARCPDAVVLTGAAAVVDDVIAAMDGATLAHLAAHGRLRLDNPMFSELRLADGPLTVHDLQRMRRAPFRVVLSACDSGLATPVGADELLGLATTLLGLGSAGVAASVTVVDDAATVPVMDRVHRSLESGAGLAESLLRARQESADSLIETATAATFIGLGV
jgi:tetratricopeptide (TPR) repeat protein